ncbi:hypothetical protein NDU88_000472 [Pleurodeles waltl]|uniref:Uncharacterized protein n=1 Tax=Pleurodeles waltl TaxID=8319 RepID=A0AAV7SWQ4_PLEWA|nr:hypothetical protein NDU88_000472 [Pleurodeles waltl]
MKPKGLALRQSGGRPGPEVGNREPSTPPPLAAGAFLRLRKGLHLSPRQAPSVRFLQDPALTQALRELRACFQMLITGTKRKRKATKPPSGATKSNKTPRHPA